MSAIDITGLDGLPTSVLLALATDDEFMIETLRDAVPGHKWTLENREEGARLIRESIDAVNAEIDARIPPRKP